MADAGGGEGMGRTPLTVIARSAADEAIQSVW
jgi:hypothetical protein